MATGPALQRTGTQIMADAKYWAQDQTTTNPAVSTPDQLLRLNDRLVWWQNVVEVRPKTLSATTTGLTFNSGDVTKTITNDTGIVNILSLHQGSSASVVYPLSKRVQRKSVEEVYAAHDLQPGQTISGGNNLISIWAAELDQATQDDWRVVVYPAPSTTLYMTIRASIDNTVSALTDTPDVSPMAARVLARLIGYDLAGVQKQNDPNYLQWILSGIPKPIQDLAFNSASRMGAQQAQITDYGSASF